MKKKIAKSSSVKRDELTKPECDSPELSSDDIHSSSEIEMENIEEKSFPRKRRSYREERSIIEDSFQENVSEKVSRRRKGKSIDLSSASAVPAIEMRTEKKESSEFTGDDFWTYFSSFFKQHIFFVLGIFFVISYLFLSLRPNSSIVDQRKYDLKKMRQSFPRQEDILWRAVVTGINETLQNDHPSSYIFLHENNSNDTMKSLLKAISEYAVCQISECNYPPIELNNEILDSSGFSNEGDYGSIIVRYKKDLENTGVMVIENLEDFPEKFALAFHSFCDEISPLVGKSVFFFTMKVEKFNSSPLYDVRTVQNILRKKWKDINEDAFGPLFTRISGMLLRVYPEK